MLADVSHPTPIDQEVLVRGHTVAARSAASPHLKALRATAVAVGIWSAARPAVAQTPEPGHPRDEVQQADWRAVDKAMGRPGTSQPGDVYKYTFPRADLRVTIGGVALKPALALGSWIAFKRMASGAMAMGDLVLTEAEVAPVMAKLQSLGVSQTAVHHHVLHESPRVLYMHVHASGDPVKIAEAVRAAIALTGTPPAAGSAPAAFPLDTARLAAALGHGGKVNGGVYQVSVPRAETITDAGMEVPPSMGLATAMNFQPTEGGKAAITGDFVLTADEVNPAIRALRGAGIEVTALHNHLLNEEPRLFFMHFWANADAVQLARGLRAALDLTNSRTP